MEDRAYRHDRSRCPATCNQRYFKTCLPFVKGIVMISNYIQPDFIKISEVLELKKYYPYYKRTIAWYSDPTVCKQVDNIDYIYDMARLKAMYRYLSSEGECYYIKYKDNGIWKLIGDISLYHGKIAIVIAKEWQNRHLGRKCVQGILERAKCIGYEQVEAEIYPFNIQSKKMFLSVGFVYSSKDKYVYNIERHISTKERSAVSAKK